MTNPFIEADRLITGHIYTSRAVMDNLEILCDDFGSRFAGTPMEKQAADFLQQTFTDYGLSNSRQEEFEYNGWTRGTASLKLTAPIEKDLPCISLPFCPPVDINAPLIDVGMGIPEDFERLADQIKGKIVMVSSRTPHNFGRWIHRKEKFERSIIAGAAAFIFVSEVPGAGPETGSLQNNSPAPIPGISISLEHGEFLRRLGRRKGELNLHLVTRDHNEPRKSWNVVAELPGQTNPDEVVVLGCHYDGHDIAQGAMDPISGMVVVLEAARVLAKVDSSLRHRTIRFIAYGAEELGLIGGRRYVAAHDEEMDKIIFNYNLDSAGCEGRKGMVLHHWPQLEDYFKHCAEEMCAELPIGQKIHAYSDHFPFFLQGVPTGHMGDPHRPPQGRGYGHTHHDTVDKVFLSDLRDASSVAARVALRIASDREFPATRRTGEEVNEIVATDHNLEGYRVAQQLAQKIGQ